MKAIFGVLFIWATLLLPVAAAESEFSVVDGWLHPPTEMETIGPAHGDVAVSENGDVYVSILAGPRPGVQVYSSDGKYLRNVPNAPNDFHGFVIHRDADGEHIYGGRLEGMEVLKLKLDGEVALRIPLSSFPESLVNKNEGKPALRLTAVDVAPDGSIFAVDGYSTDRIHIFDAQGKYLSTLGGKDSPYEFKTNHKICIDTRFDPPRVLCCDRENRRVVTLSLDGKVLNVVQQMRRPAAVAVWGDLAAIAEIEGRVSLLDKEGRTVLTLGENTVKEQTATNQVKPADWRAGIFTAPHGVDFDQHGNVFVTEFNQFGRVVRYNRR